MLARSALRAQPIARRGFHSTRQLQGGYHYPEGPRSNIPFDPLKKGFAIKYWGFMAVGFGTPFAIAAWQLSKAP